MITASPFQIVLVEPEIPPNTGNIARLCAATGTPLHLIEPLGFSLDDRYLKRAGLDYWPEVKLTCWPDWTEFLKNHGDHRFWLTTKKADATYLEADFRPGDMLIFGKETTGLPDSILSAYSGRSIRIPIFSDQVRSLNLSTAAGIVLYEALRQTDCLAAGRQG